MAQEIIRISTINTSVVNVATTEVIKIEGVGLQGNTGADGSPGGVTSINGEVGIVVLESDDISDSGQTNKYATAAQLTAISDNTSDIATLQNETVIDHGGATAEGFTDMKVIVHSSLMVDENIKYTIDANSAPFWFITKDVSTISPKLTGAGAGTTWDMGDGTILVGESVSHTYSNSSIEHTVMATDFDVLDVTNLESFLDGITVISNLGGFKNLLNLRLDRNPLLAKVGGTIELTSITGNFWIWDCNLTGNLDIPIAPLMPVIRLSGNTLLTSLSSFLGNNSLNNTRVDDGDLDQTTVDMILVESYANALAGTLTNGTINLSGGTNAIPSNTTPVNDAISGLLGLGYTLTLNS